MSVGLRYFCLLIYFFYWGLGVYSYMWDYPFVVEEDLFLLYFYLGWGPIIPNIFEHPYFLTPLYRSLQWGHLTNPSLKNCFIISLNSSWEKLVAFFSAGRVLASSSNCSRIALADSKHFLYNLYIFDLSGFYFYTFYAFSPFSAFSPFLSCFICYF